MEKQDQFQSHHGISKNLEKKYTFIDDEKDKQRIISRQKREAAYKKYKERIDDEKNRQFRMAQILKRERKEGQVACIIPETQESENRKDEIDTKQSP